MGNSALNIGVVNLSDLLDVDTAVPNNSHVLIGNGTEFNTRALNTSDVSDFDTEVSNNASVVANTAKVGVTTEISDIVEDLTPQLGGDLDLNENGVEFNPSPDDNQTANGMYYTLQNVSGATINFGEVCIFTSGGGVNLADADTSVLATLVCIDGSVSNLATGRFMFLGTLRNDTWAWTAGNPVYKSTTAGAFTQTAPSAVGDFVQVLGMATSADTIHFQPSYSQVGL